MTAVHLDGAFLNVRAAALRMVRSSAKGGRSSTSHRSMVAMRTVAGHATGNAGVTMLTRVAGLELAASGIHVNAIAPGVVETDSTRAVMSDPDVAARWVGRIPLPVSASRMTSPISRYFCLATRVVGDWSNHPRRWWGLAPHRARGDCRRHVVGVGAERSRQDPAVWSSTI